MTERHGGHEGQDHDRVLDPLQERELEQVEGYVVAVERVRLAERLCPKEADEVVPSFREAEPDDDRRHERSQYLERPNQPSSDGGCGAWKERRHARRSRSDLIP